MWRSQATHLPNYYGTRLLAPRIMLRPPKVQDYSNWHAVRARNHAFLQPYEPRWADNALTEKFFRDKIAAQKQNWIRDSAYAFFIVADDDSTILGGMNINHVARGAAQHGTLGYWLDEAEQGKGYMAEALNATIIFANDGLGLNRLHAATIPENVRSRSLLARAGFIEEGFAQQYVSINGVWADHVLYGLVLS